MKLCNDNNVLYCVLFLQTGAHGDGEKETEADRQTETDRQEEAHRDTQRQTDLSLIHISEPTRRA